MKRSTDWNRLKKMTDEEAKSKALSDPDAQPTDIDFWRSANVIMPSSEPKKHISIRIDSDILEFFKKGHKRGYQKRINTVLRSYIESELRKGTT